MKRCILFAVAALCLVAAGLICGPHTAALAQTAGYVPGVGEIVPYPVTNQAIVTFKSAAKLAQSTVAQLPTCNATAKGNLRAVTDATSPTYNGTLTGGGAVFVPVVCNGTAWVSH